MLSEIKLMDQKHFIIFLSRKQLTLEFGDANSGLDLEAEEDVDRWDVQLSSTPGENNIRVFYHSRLFLSIICHLQPRTYAFFFSFRRKNDS